MDQQEKFKLLTQALMHSSAAHGSAMDALLTIIVPLAEQGLITKAQTDEFMKSVREQFEQTENINKLISKLTGVPFDEQ